MVSLGLKIRHISGLHLKSRASKRKDTCNGGVSMIKWQELEFSHLLSSALKYPEPLSIAPRIAKIARNTCGQVRPDAFRSQI
jgi:hypothetical protein